MAGREAEIQRLWASGIFRGRPLRTASGTRLRVVYEGRRGPGAGPDFRDAVLEDAEGARHYGDVEIHLRAANWRAHGHDRDHRYDAVALHVVLCAGAERETVLADGTSAPLTVLEVAGLDEVIDASPLERSMCWPCHGLAERIGGPALRGLLRELGVRRLNERAERFAEEIGRAEQCEKDETGSLWRPGERVLWAALAEGLGYGRDRASLRAAGIWLIRDGAEGERWVEMPSIERKRLAGLQHLLERWRGTGPWTPLDVAIGHGSPRRASEALTRELCVGGGAVSAERARILAANVVLPFTVAQAQLNGDTACEARALEVYVALAAPSSNTITRLLARQFGMSRLPNGATTHMGLQQLWTASCRQKLCATCPCANR